MIIDMQSSAIGVSPLDSPFWQLGTPPIGTSQNKGVGGPVEDIQTVTGNAGLSTGASASVTGSAINLPN